MTTTTGPHRSRHEHLQGLLQRKAIPVRHRGGLEPRDREIAARNRQLDHLLDQ